MDQPAPTHWVGGDIPGLVVPGGVLAWDGGSGGCWLGMRIRGMLAWDEGQGDAHFL